MENATLCERFHALGIICYDEDRIIPWLIEQHKIAIVIEPMEFPIDCHIFMFRIYELHQNMSIRKHVCSDVYGKTYSECLNKAAEIALNSIE